MTSNQELDSGAWGAQGYLYLESSVGPAHMDIRQVAKSGFQPFLLHPGVFASINRLYICETTTLVFTTKQRCMVPVNGTLTKPL